MKTQWLTATLLLGLLACGDDGQASSSTSGGGATSSTPAGVGGAGGGGGSPATTGTAGGGGEGGAPEPVCPAEELCSLIMSSEEIFDCEDRHNPFMNPLPADRVADARCVLEALRDRKPVSVRVGFDNASYCGDLFTISIGSEEAHLLRDDYLDLGWTQTRGGHALLDAATYQACLDLPDEELHTCFGPFMLYGEPVACPLGCTCD
jgi:hypothetical protein